MIDPAKLKLMVESFIKGRINYYNDRQGAARTAEGFDQAAWDVAVAYKLAHFETLDFLRSVGVTDDNQ